MALPLVLFLGTAVLWPLARLAAEVLAGPGLGALREVLAAGRYRTSLVQSLALSAAAAATAVALAVFPAWVLAREGFPGSALLRALVSLPLTFSGGTAGFLIVVLLGRTAAATWAGLSLAYLYFEVPRAVAVLEPALRRFPSELDAAARTLGASWMPRLLHIGLPLAAPALRTALAVTFSAALGSFGAALVLAPHLALAPLEVSTGRAGSLDGPMAGAICLVLAAVALTADRLLAGAPRGSR